MDAPAYVKVTLSLHPGPWHAFREACLHRHVSASRVIRDFVAAQLTTWEKEDTAKDQTTDK